MNEEIFRLLEKALEILEKQQQTERRVSDLERATLAIQKTLGTMPHGSAESVKDFLQKEHNIDGSHKEK